MVAEQLDRHGFKPRMDQLSNGAKMLLMSEQAYTTSTSCRTMSVLDATASRWLIAYALNDVALFFWLARLEFDW